MKSKLGLYLCFGTVFGMIGVVVGVGPDARAADTLGIYSKKCTDPAPANDKRPVLMLVHAAWCPACRYFIRETTGIGLPPDEPAESRAQILNRGATLAKTFRICSVEVDQQTSISGLKGIRADLRLPVPKLPILHVYSSDGKLLQDLSAYNSEQNALEGKERSNVGSLPRQLEDYATGKTTPPGVAPHATLAMQLSVRAVTAPQHSKGATASCFRAVEQVANELPGPVTPSLATEGIVSSSPPWVAVSASLSDGAAARSGVCLGSDATIEFVALDPLASQVRILRPGNPATRSEGPATDCDYSLVSLTCAPASGALSGDRKEARAENRGAEDRVCSHRLRSALLVRLNWIAAKISEAGPQLLDARMEQLKRLTDAARTECSALIDQQKRHNRFMSAASSSQSIGALFKEIASRIQSPSHSPSRAAPLDPAGAAGGGEAR